MERRPEVFKETEAVRRDLALDNYDLDELTHKHRFNDLPEIKLSSNDSAFLFLKTTHPPPPLSLSTPPPPRAPTLSMCQEHILPKLTILTDPLWVYVPEQEDISNEIVYVCACFGMTDMVSFFGHLYMLCI